VAPDPVGSDYRTRGPWLISFDNQPLEKRSYLSPEVISMPTLHREITACFEKGHSATIIFSPIHSDILTEVEIPYHKVRKLCDGKEWTLLWPSHRIEYSL